MTTLRLLIADDEPIARSRMRQLLRGLDSVEIVGECENGYQAVERCQALQPDLMLLDIAMPGINGIQVVQELQRGACPLIAFFTAHAEFAPQAFEVDAIDYLLKPFERDRLRDTLMRARRALARIPTERRTRIGLEAGGRVFVFDPSEVAWIQAAGNYVRIHREGEEVVVRATLKQLRDRLATHGFHQLHRSHLVNVEHVRSLRMQANGDAEIRLRNGLHLKASRNFRAAIQRLRRELIGRAP